MRGADRMPQVTPFVGLDVHASQTHAGVLDPVTGELVRRRLRGDPLVALEFLERLGPHPLAVYEAGPTGFGAGPGGGRARRRGPRLRSGTDSWQADRPRQDRRSRRRALGAAAGRGRAFLRARPDCARGTAARLGQSARGSARRSPSGPPGGCRTCCAAAGFASPGQARTGPTPTGPWLRRLEFDDAPRR
jgi:transposase